MNGEEAPKKKKTWLWIILGVFVFFVMIAVGGIVVAVSLFRQNFSVSDNISADNAEAQFAAIHAKFPGQQPLLQMKDDRPEYVAERASQSGSGTPLTTMHILAFDRDEGKVVNFSVPFWLLRMKSGPFRISAYQQGWNDRGFSLRVEDIEKHGPGIILDATRPDEGRVLVWAE